MGFQLGHAQKEVPKTAIAVLAQLQTPRLFALPEWMTGSGGDGGAMNVRNGVGSGHRKSEAPAAEMASTADQHLRWWE